MFIWKVKRSLFRPVLTWMVRKERKHRFVGIDYDINIKFYSAATCLIRIKLFDPDITYSLMLCSPTLYPQRKAILSPNSMFNFVTKCHLNMIYCWQKWYIVKLSPLCLFIVFIKIKMWINSISEPNIKKTKLLTRHGRFKNKNYERGSFTLQLKY